MGARPIVLSIAGYDPSSGAGITADVKTAAALGCYAVTCITALTVQSTQGVFGVEPVRPELVRQTLFRLAEDVEIAAVRIGMLGSGEVAGVVADFLAASQASECGAGSGPAVVVGGESGRCRGVGGIRGQLSTALRRDNPESWMRRRSWPATVPGRFPRSDSWEVALPRIRGLAAKLHDLGCRGVVITGGHLCEANDYLSVRADGGTAEQVFPGSRLASQATHGTGCAFATALACGLAQGSSVVEAITGAKEFVRKAITAAYPVGKGVGPMHHLFRLDARSAERSPIQVDSG